MYALHTMQHLNGHCSVTFALKYVLLLRCNLTICKRAPQFGKFVCIWLFTARMACLSCASIVSIPSTGRCSFIVITRFLCLIECSHVSGKVWCSVTHPCSHPLTLSFTHILAPSQFHLLSVFSVLLGLRPKHEIAATSLTLTLKSQLYFILLLVYEQKINILMHFGCFKQMLTSAIRLHSC